MSLIEYPDSDLMMMDLADRLSSELKSALMTHDHVTFAVPGGTTPGPLFDTLSSLRLDWDRVTVMPTDERWVGPAHERSNARLIRERLLTGPAAAARFRPLYVDGVTPEQALAGLNAAVAPMMPINVLLLGMGADMHTASLFPGAPGLDAALDATAPPLAVTRPAGQPEARVTLTAPALWGALSTHVVVTGDDKRAALERASKLPVQEAPVHAVLTNATVHWAP
ncbi:6-phosphogluconolactonase [Rhodovulum sp. 12E13]|uniref:6-phosphogluconolactonase n=1 Tax=Rhodovulum sp. 12E13 TaxID=2203891 RepID=UPI000E12F894|nr:6-phosphogluconolactonase [Rhodovulum sp. 12E13]RDC73449.1 6-phosphogluconolactonase [Rhodovulum sp. 12E13]